MAIDVSARREEIAMGRAPISTLRKTARRARTARRALLVVVGAAVLWLAVATSLTSAAPSYTDWSTPVSLGPVVNTAVPELGPAISADGLSLYFYSARPGGFGGNDYWVSKRPTVGSPWGPAANVGPGINTAAGESAGMLSSDGHWFFFTRDALGGGFGGADLYQSYRADVHDDFGWQPATNLGANVNTAADEGGAGYFDNGGAPQLWFGSTRPGGLGANDIYVSNRQADGSWGPASAVPGLNSASDETRPNVRLDGLEIVFYSNRPGGFGSNDLWSATRAAADAPWSTPVNLGPMINTTSAEQHPSLSANGRTLYFGSNRPGFGAADLYVTTRNAQLTVTANDQTRLFGRTNPPLTTSFSGFVGGETAAVVSGAAACTTTASPSSPGGTYPITCTAGTLAATGYGFSTFVAGTLTVTYSSPCLTGPRTGPLTVSAGEALCIGAGGSQSGPVTVDAGGSLDVEGGSITGSLNANGATGIRLCGATVAGPVTIGGGSGLVLVGGDQATGPCDANSIIGPVRIAANAAGVEFNANTVTGPLRITGNTGSLPPPDTGSVHAAGNTVTGPATIQP
jgi:hypothetical protein